MSLEHLNRGRHTCSAVIEIRVVEFLKYYSGTSKNHPPLGLHFIENTTKAGREEEMEEEEDFKTHNGGGLALVFQEGSH